MQTSRFNIGKSLRKAQADRRVTNKALAQTIGVSHIQIAKWRSKEDMRFSRVAQLADHFNMTLDEFVSMGQ